MKAVEFFFKGLQSGTNRLQDQDGLTVSAEFLVPVIKGQDTGDDVDTRDEAFPNQRPGDLFSLLPRFDCCQANNGRRHGLIHLKEKVSLFNLAGKALHRRRRIDG